MSASQKPRIFISYAVKDGSDAARALRQRLEAEGFSIWQDVVALEGGRDWWSQIEDAIRAPSVEHVVLVVSPTALSRTVVRREIRLAKTLGKLVTPIRSGPELDLDSLPRWLGHVLDLQKPEHWEQLLTTVRGSSRQARVPMMAPEPPADFVARPKEFEALKRQLLDAKGDAAVGLTAALRGAGGYGKTTLAKALAHDSDIQEAYFDGVLWVELGEQGAGRVVTLIRDIVTLITGEPPAVVTPEAAAAALADAFGDRRFRLIIDDVWQRAALDPFLKGGASTTRLITTRFDRELPEATARQPVDAMAQSEALALVSWGLPLMDAQSATRELQALSAKLGEWAQLLKLVNGFLRDRVIKHRQTLPTAILDVTRRLDARGLAAFDDSRAKDYGARHRSIAAVINTTLELLDNDQRARFFELGIFPEDADVPIGIVARLWTETGGLDEIATEDLLRELYDLSLLLTLDFDNQTFRFHDTTRQFLQDRAGKDGLAVQHKRLLRAIDDMGGATETDERSKRYFYEYLPEHLSGAGDRATLDALLLDPGWLRDKLAATSSPLSLVVDYDRFGQGEMQSLIGQTLRLTTGICTNDPRQLLPQLHGRLMAVARDAAPSFLSRTRGSIQRPALVMQRATLAPPGAEISRLEGHAEAVLSLALLPDGRLASGSADNRIYVWDTKSGAITATLLNFQRGVMVQGGVSALAALPDGRLVSGNGDKSIRVWDPITGAETARFKRHNDVVTALAVLPDGRLASGSEDGSVRIWDVAMLRDRAVGAQIFRLEAGFVWSLAVLPDGQLASGSNDGIHIWNCNTGTEVCRLLGHTGGVKALAVLPDGQLVSGGYDGTIRLWDRSSAEEKQRLRVNGDLSALCVLPGGRMVSAATGDNHMCLWDAASGTQIGRLNGHTGRVAAIVALPDGRLASGSRDPVIRVWDPAREASVADHGFAAETSRHTGAVTALAVLAEQKVASGSQDKTIRLWSLDPEVESVLMQGDPGSVTALAVLPGGRLVSGSSDDNAIHVWDIDHKTEIAKLAGHSGAVTSLAILSDGRLVSGSRDSTIRIWSPDTGALTAALDSKVAIRLQRR